MRLFWAGIVVALAAFAALPPLLSHDVYSYVDYARLGALHGLDPYVHPPLSVPSDPAFPHVDWRETTSVYGPLFTLAAYPLAWLPVGAAVYVLKATSALAVFATALIVARLAPARGVDPLRAAAFVALNPLVLVHVVGGPHNDAFAVLLMTVGVAALLSAREISAGATLTAAATVKASTAIVLPFALAAARPRAPTPGPTPGPMGRFVKYALTNRPIGPLGGLVAGGLMALVAIGAAAWLAFGWDWLHAFALAGESQGRTSHLSIPTTTARLTGLDPHATRIAFLAAYATFVLYLLHWTWRGNDWLRAAAWATTALLIASSWLLPWYLLWPLPLAALSRDRPLQALLLALTAYQLAARIPL